jgi:hypothetical protein
MKKKRAGIGNEMNINQVAMPIFFFSDGIVRKALSVRSIL